MAKKHRYRFRRTICACKKCVAACLHMPGSLMVGDLERLVNHLGVKTFDAWLLANFQASEGPLVSAAGKLFHIPTIVPKLTATGCVFLQEGRCTVHAVSPFGCAYVDMHMGKEDADARVQPALQAVLEDHRRQGPYSRAWQKLKAAGCVATLLVDRRENLAQAIHQIEQT